MNWLVARRIMYAVVAVAVVAGGGYLIWMKTRPQVHTLVVHPGDFLQQVSVSGTITPTETVDLSFQQSGTVTAVRVQAGDKVAIGQLLASQDVSQLQAQLAQMQAGIDLQQAKLNQLLAGESPQSIQVSQDAVDSAQQDLQNAYAAALNNLQTARTAVYNAGTEAVSIQNSYFTNNDQASLKVQDARTSLANALADATGNVQQAQALTDDTHILAALTAVSKDVSTAFDAVSIIREQCDEGAYYQRVSAADKTALDTEKSDLTAALSDITASQTAIAADKAALQQAQSKLQLAQAPPQQSDIAVYQAQIAQAQAQKQDVLAQIATRQLRSPMNAVVTNVAAKLGSVSAANQTAISLISSAPLQIDSYVPETYIPLVSVGNAAQVTFDANGIGDTFQAKVVSIDPAQTVQDGVATYKTVLEFDAADARIKPGMSCNVVITTQQKHDVIAIPQGLVTTSNDGTQWVKVREGAGQAERQVTTGSVASNGTIEIVSGLKDGDIVTIP